MSEITVCPTLLLIFPASKSANILNTANTTSYTECPFFMIINCYVHSRNLQLRLPKNTVRFSHSHIHSEKTSMHNVLPNIIYTSICLKEAGRFQTLDGGSVRSLSRPLPTRGGSHTGTCSSHRPSPFPQSERGPTLTPSRSRCSQHSMEKIGKLPCMSPDKTVTHIYNFGKALKHRKLRNL